MNDVRWSRSSTPAPQQPDPPRAVIVAAELDNAVRELEAAYGELAPVIDRVREAAQAQRQERRR